MNAVVAIVSPLEIPYLDEWIGHHRDLGFERFVLYLNDWNDRQAEAVDFPDFVTATRFDGPRMQLPAYDDGMRRCLADSRIAWAAFIDCDEFVRIRSNRNLGEILGERGFQNQLALNWRLFGSSGRTVFEDRPVTERFRKCGRELNPHVKQLINAGWYRSMGVCPSFRGPHNTSFLSMNLEGHAQVGAFNRENLDRVHEIEISHYVTKSYDECVLRRSYRRADCGIPREEGAVGFFSVHDVNEIDESELAFAIPDGIGPKEGR